MSNKEKDIWEERRIAPDETITISKWKNKKTFETHNDTEVGINRTCLQGYINAHYYRLVDFFGEPMESDGYKTDAEWQIEFEDGTVATVYNWKNGLNYCGADGTPVEYITEWNVGGKNGTDAVNKVKTALENEDNSLWNN
jgi:hypothetical protein